MSTYNREKLIDTYLKSHFAGDDGASAAIEPSPDFVQRTMKVVVAYDRKRQTLRDVAVVALAGFPLFIRQAWMGLRSDYFNIGSLPLVGGAMTSVYQFVLSSAVLNVLILSSFLFIASYLSRRPWLQRRIEMAFQAIS